MPFPANFFNQHGPMTVVAMVSKNTALLLPYAATPRYELGHCPGHCPVDPYWFEETLGVTHGVGRAQPGRHGLNSSTAPGVR